MKQKSIAPLVFLRDNRKASREEMHEHFGSDGIFLFDLFQARYSQVRKQKDGIKTNTKREMVIDQMIDEVLSGSIKNPMKDYKRKENITKILITLGAILSAIGVFVFGGALLILLPPIWIIVILLLWIIKKT